MATLAIKGHETRESEVIGLLEMLGGKNDNYCRGGLTSRIYFINENGCIESCDRMHNLEYRRFTLEGFKGKFPYKVGDKVNVCGENAASVIGMRWESDYVVYRVKLEKNGYETSKMVEELQPYTEQKEESMKEGILYDEVDFTRSPYADKVKLILGKDYEIKEENGEWYVVKKQPKYPKTYEECRNVVDFCRGDVEIDLPQPYQQKMFNLFKLLVCRDAYWKITVKQMGFNKPWKPDWCNENKLKYCIGCSYGTIDRRTMTCNRSHILAFPTEEMRDAFYENFKELIEECKELL